MKNMNVDNFLKNKKIDSKYTPYNFDRVEVYDIEKARENILKSSRARVYDYASKVSEVINSYIKKESEIGNTKCNVYINLKEIFSDAAISTKDYSSMLDYITGLYSLKGYDISVHSSRRIIQFPIKEDNIYLKVYISWG